ncbi:nuclear factor 7, brain-like [Aplochiton taeniatus]
MASLVSLELKCAVCLTVFKDPVSLPCDHTYCRLCIIAYLGAHSVKTQGRCPECRAPFSQADLRTHRIVTHMADSVRDRKKRSSLSKAIVEESTSPQLICLKHDEKLKLFCETDQSLACVICRDEASHQGHTFKPVSEAADTVKNVVKGALGFLGKENLEMGELYQKQTIEISTTHVMNLTNTHTHTSKSLSTHISKGFEELHQFLTKREEEVKQELKLVENNAVSKMTENSYEIEKRLTDSMALQGTLQSAMMIPEYDNFLQWWTDTGISLVKMMENKFTAKEGKTLYTSKTRDLHVVPESLTLGPYESHLALFIWKELRQIAKPGPERLTLKDSGTSYVKVSADRTSVRHADRSFTFRDHPTTVFSTESFQTGQHYWEVEVRGKVNWAVGLKVEKLGTGADSVTLQGAPEKEILLLLKPEKGLVFSHDGVETCIKMASGLQTQSETQPQTGPSVVGLYLDCDRQNVSFYNADTMTLLHSAWCSYILPCFICLSPGLYLKGSNAKPVVVCC